MSKYVAINNVSSRELRKKRSVFEGVANNAVALFLCLKDFFAAHLVNEPRALWTLG